MLSGSSLFILIQRSHDFSGMSPAVSVAPAAPAVTPEVLDTLSPITFVIVPIGSGGNLVWSRGVVAVLGEFRRARGGPYWALAGIGGTLAALAAPAVPPMILAAFQP